MKRLILILFLIAPLSAFACDCTPLPVALEFLTSKYIFWGKVSEKEYMQDSLAYKVTFTVEKHFKRGAKNPKILSFYKKAEGEFTGKYTSCDYNVNKDENWLVYAYEAEGRLEFSYFCSNSKPYNTFEQVSQEELDILSAGNKIDLNKIIFDKRSVGSIAYSDIYQHPKPLIPLDTLLAQIDIQPYKSEKFHFENLVVNIDSKGNVIDIIVPSRSHHTTTIYSISYLIYHPMENLTSHQKVILEKISESRSWEPAKFMGRNVNSRIYLQVYLDDNKLRVSSVY